MKTKAIMKLMLGQQGSGKPLLAERLADLKQRYPLLFQKEEDMEISCDEWFPNFEPPKPLKKPNEREKRYDAKQKALVEKYWQNEAEIDRLQKKYDKKETLSGATEIEWPETPEAIEDKKEYRHLQRQQKRLNEKINWRKYEENAANMDQAGGVAEKRREFLTNSRFATGAADLIGSGKISRGKDGVWRANGRLSNLNQAILDRLNAEQNKKNVEKEQDKVVKKLDELIQKLEQMSTL